MEICIDSLESARNAIEGGAKRLEVCSALSEGGLTPTPGLVKKIKSFSPIPVYAMLRLRAGNFVYIEEDTEVMLQDLKILKDHGADGFVFGALTLNGKINVDLCEEVLSEASPLSVTFHRAFDEVNDPMRAVETLIELGFERILTSGQKDTAKEGLELIQKLVQVAQDRIIIMPGSGITKDNIFEIKITSGAKEFHASAKRMAVISSGNRVKIGANKESSVMVTDSGLVREMVSIITV
ncbi:PREDICTED: copper homeostasis protein cutC homolog [Dufourea novaeangliae]|uniref:Copper homeostasis protein cutC homolog n=1 Tax=Dufourea novaeangliae TaxID=178035 RepID=A0A154P2D2_DUFNO|nr:PREDICTED: copper homeostasis protein cutC homolog [Dufourea novaeangliae]KZC06017.1 Copper homeostasis protein cutC like protein [Dufourea novaeangliae]